MWASSHLVKNSYKFKLINFHKTQDILGFFISKILKLTFIS